MAAGLNPNFIAHFPLDNLSPEDFLVIANEAIAYNQWNAGLISRTQLEAFTNRGVFKRNAKITITINVDTADIKSQSTGSEMIDMGMNKKTVQEFIDAFNIVKANYSEEQLKDKFQELKGSLSDNENVLQTTENKSQKISNFISFFKPRPGYFITPILVDLNILVYVLMVISGVNFFLPDNISLINWGANFRPVTLDGQWWRLITNFFVHIGIIHLVFNMYALLYIGLLLEPYLGKARFCAAYFLTGVIASLTSLAWHDLTISAGASGAIFGLYGVFLALLTTNIIPKATRVALLSSIAVFVGYNLLNGMKAGIDNAAHVGGLLTGLIIGYAYYPTLKKPLATDFKYSIIGMLTIVVITTSFAVYKKIPNDIGIYQTKMQLFAQNEQSALAIYRLSDSTSKIEQLVAIKDSGITNWNKNIMLLNEMSNLKLPAAYNDRDNILLDYCNARLNLYNLLYKQVDENTDVYKDSINIYTSQIENLINELKQDSN